MESHELYSHMTWKERIGQWIQRLCLYSPIQYMILKIRVHHENKRYGVRGGGGVGGLVLGVSSTTNSIQLCCMPE